MGGGVSRQGQYDIARGFNPSRAGDRERAPRAIEIARYIVPSPRRAGGRRILDFLTVFGVGGFIACQK